KLSLGTAAVVALVLVPIIACVSGGADQVAIGSDCPNGFCTGDSGPSFTAPPVEAGEGGDHSTSLVPLLACVGTTCPAPYATCSKTPSFLCGTNLLNDAANCGACGVSCEGFEGINLGARCVKGACAFECLIKKTPDGTSDEFRNCNGLLDDGC
ncbi:MAG: Tryptophan synthase alpha chain, partial [Myxococcaceae bacterium]|nr:Tryptophan synthase alpha chain [Myxococcaceae bacterium]